MNHEILGEVLWLLAGSVLVVTVFRRINLPPIIGYLFVGMMLGPSALGLVKSVDDARVLAEFGVVFLLFTLGLEFSLSRMMVMKAEVFGLGSAQVGVTSLIVATVCWLSGLEVSAAVLVGGAVAMSSTAIVIKQLTEQLEIGRTHGRIAVGVLLFQDLAIVPFLVLISALGGSDGTYSIASVASALLKGLAAIVIVFLSGRYLLRPLFHEIGKTRIAEVFTLAVLLVALGSAWATESAGLSLALGGFLAGMLLAETEFRHQIETDIRPFRDVLLGLFFITIGMLVDFRGILEHIELVAMLVCVLVFGKAALTTALARYLAGTWHGAFRGAIVTAQGGEFGLALLTLALQGNLIPTSIGEPLLAAIVVSMALSPLIVRHNAQLAGLLFSDRRPTQGEQLTDDLIVQSVASREHVIICGFGRVGQNIARILDAEGFEYIALDLDPQRVRRARQAGDPVFFGNAERNDILSAVGLATASVVVISFSDARVALNIVRSVREVRGDVPLLVRTADDSYLEELEHSGATAIIPETLEASLVIVSQVLSFLQLPELKIAARVQGIRDQRYGELRNLYRKEDARPLDDSHAYREELQNVSLSPKCHAVGKTLDELELEDHEVVVTAIRRDGIVGRSPAGDTMLRAGDVLALYGTPESLESASKILLEG